MNISPEVIGYTGYGLLCVIALFWVIGVRCVLTAKIPTIVGSLTFLLAAMALPIFRVSLMYSWLAIVALYLLIWIVYIPVTAHRVPILWPILLAIGSVYAALIRYGIHPDDIQDAWDEEFYAHLIRRATTPEESELAWGRYERWKSMKRDVGKAA